MSPLPYPLRCVSKPIWAGSRFAQEEAQELWLQLPEKLRLIAIQELQAGNVPDSIQLDLKTKVVLLAFSHPPRLLNPNEPDIVVHTKHEYGNYCYEGTVCTYEFVPQRAFLAFNDPNFLGENVE